MRGTGWPSTPRLTKMGMAPLSITTRVCSEVPEEMLVSVQAASKRSVALSSVSALDKTHGSPQKGIPGHGAKK